MLDLDSLDGLNIQRRIKHVVDQGHSATVVYTQKAPSSEAAAATPEKKKPILFNRSIGEFNESQQEYVCEQLHDFNHIFDYCSPQTDEADPLYTVSEAWLQE